MKTLSLTQGFLEKRKYLNGIILLLLIVCISSCKKTNEPIWTNNEMKANVVLSSGNTISINASGLKARIGRDLWLGGIFVEGTNDANAAIYLNTGTLTITRPGTYVFDCQYRPDVSSQSTPIYTNSGVSNPGSITFTVFNDHYMEGHFNAVCAYNSSDSVVVSGSFKGNY